MPGRDIPLIDNEIYHVLNRGSASQLIFQNKRNYSRALETLFYYQNRQPPIRYSKFLSLSVDRRTQILKDLSKQKNFLVEIISYCFIPNHFHLILKQAAENGISKFTGNFTNSYTRYFNTKNERFGPLFQGKFKAIRIETDEQLLHVSRYVHLNPYTSCIVKTIYGLEDYPYSSLPEFLGKTENNFCSKDLILNQFKSKNQYRQFVLDQADYQRTLENIKHLAIEK